MQLIMADDIGWLEVVISDGTGWIRDSYVVPVQ